MKTIKCSSCRRDVKVGDDKLIETHDVSDSTLEVCEMSGTEHTPGPADWGVRYKSIGQRDPFDPSKPIAR